MKRPTKSGYSGKFQSLHKAGVEKFKPHLFLISSFKFLSLFAELNQASEVAAVHVLVHPAVAPTSQPDSPAARGSKAAELGEHTKLPSQAGLSCVPNLVSPCNRKQHKLATATGSQTWRSLSFYLPLPLQNE